MFTNFYTEVDKLLGNTDVKIPDVDKIGRSEIPKYIQALLIQLWNKDIENHANIVPISEKYLENELKLYHEKKRKLVILFERYLEMGNEIALCCYMHKIDHANPNQMLYLVVNLGGENYEEQQRNEKRFKEMTRAEIICHSKTFVEALQELIAREI